MGSALAKSRSPQRLLFPRLPAWERDAQGEVLVARVLFPRGPQGQFDYRVPPGLWDKIEVGMRVRVPLGPSDRLRVGYCVALMHEHPQPQQLKEVAQLLDSQPLLTPQLLELSQWMARRYVCPWPTVLEGMIPAGVRSGSGKRWATVLELAPGAREKASKLQLSRKQLLALEHLASASEPMRAEELARAAGCTLAPIRALRQKGLVRARRVRLRTAVVEQKPLPARQEPFEPTPQQRQALEAILQALRQRRHEVFLLHGITGSGKTEVYLQAIAHVVSSGRQAIVLVPEISLTPQTRQRFEARLGRVALLHSHLSDAQRSWYWEQIARGQVNVVIGARSAIFAPTPQLGLIVVDEEHESSFKQENAPRYHAREVALRRGQLEGVPVVLGSATPSLESYHAAQQGHFRLLRLTQRINRLPLPQVKLIDLRLVLHPHRASSLLSPPLQNAMREVLQEGGQVILLLNRRGYSPHVQCPACGHTMQCPHCEISLTYHRQDAVVLCHYCQYELPAPSRCVECGFAGIRFFGWGTQRLEAEVQRRFPGYRALRMDTDAMRRPGSHQQALEAFQRGEVQILLGTQMIAKGLDFPRVHLVGVINADTALHLPDFRASERTFQLLVQVAGRAGRGDRRGLVLVQSFTPEHPVLQCAAAQQYEQFAQTELKHRQELGYPPFGHLARVVVRGPVAQRALAWAQQAAQRVSEELRAQVPQGRLLGPAPAPLARLRGHYRFHFQVLVPGEVPLWDLLDQTLRSLKPPEEIHLIVDVDPVNML